MATKTKTELIKIKAFQTRVFGEEGTPPCSQTIRRHLMSGAIPGKLVGGLWFVDWIAYQRMTGNDLVDSVLNYRKTG